MSLAVLKITDGTTEVDLLSEGIVNGFALLEWEPVIQDWKDGGVYQDSSLADGRQPVDAKLANALETLTLELAEGSQDNAARAWQDLRRLLYQAVRYWIDDYRTAPVWIEARSGCETYSRYALIYNWRTPADANPYAPPFTNPAPIAATRQLILERGPWLESEPGAGVCAEASDLHTGNNGAQLDLSSSACYDTGGGFSFNQRYLGAGVNRYDLLLLFDGSAIPQGATIISARLILRAYSTLATDNVNVSVVGDDEDTAVAFTTAVDYLARPITAASVAWNAVEHFITGGWYNSPELSTVVQEIVDRAGWTGPIGLFCRDNGSTGGATRRIGAAPIGTAGSVLYIVYATSTGRAATCLSEAYIANKHNYSELHYAFYYDASSGIYSANIIGAALPANLLPGTPAAGDLLYIGTDTSLADTGPFSSVVFDLVAGSDFIAQFEFYSSDGGGTWVVMAGPFHDDTASLQNSGVCSFNFPPPPTWITTTVNGITGYWIRLNVTDVGGAPVGPQQQNRDLYTATTPYITIDDAQLPGDLPALLRAWLDNKSGAYTGRVFIGARQIDRGADFTAYLNCADEQNPAFVTVSISARCAYANSITAPTGRVVTFTPGGPAVMANRVTFTIPASYTPQWMGRYRAFVRVSESTTTGDYQYRLLVYLNYSLVWQSQTATANTAQPFQAVDLGLITIPDVRTTGDEAYRIFLRVQASAALGTGTLNFIDLILLPVDEWFGQFDVVPATQPMDNSEYLDVDSISSQKVLITATGREQGTNEIDMIFMPIVSGPAQLFVNADTKLWFLVENYTDSGRLDAYPHTLHRAKFERQARYYSLRGDR